MKLTRYLRLPLLIALTATFVFIVMILIHRTASAQARTYKSEIDSSLTLKKIAVFPVLDNVSGIYAKPLTEKLLEVLNQDRRFEIISVPSSKLSPEQYEEQPEAVSELLKTTNADAILTTRLIKGPRGISLRLVLIGGSKNLPLVQERLDDYAGFETNDIKIQIEQLSKTLLNRLPYQSVVTSRKGQLVTINAGATHGLKVGDELFVVLISNVERHPKFKFLTKVDREIMGKVKLAKVDESVSFGSLTAERTANLVQSGFKVSWSEMVQYPEVGLAQNGDIIPAITAGADAATVYGESPKEWRTGQNASFGKVSLLAGLGQTSLSTSLSTGETPSSTNSFSPVIRIDGEMWIDPNWQFNAMIEQLAAKVSNGLAGSTPESLNMQLQEMTLLFGYNFLVEPDNFWGPKFQLLGGFSKISLFVDDTSPQSHTSKDYSGAVLGFGGAFPLVSTDNSRFLLGGKFLYYWEPSMSESPSSSGGSSNKVSHFNVFLEYGLNQRMAFRTDLNFKQLSSSFSGGSANSASANFINAMAGAAFYF